MNEGSAVQGILQQFSPADWALLGVLLLSTGYGLVRGGVNEVFATLTWVGAILISFFYYSEVSSYLGFIANPLVASIVAGAILFCGVVVVGGFASLGASKFLYHTGLSGTDHLLGLIFGLIRGLLLVELIYLGMRYLPLINEPWWANSFIVRHLDVVHVTAGIF